MVQQEALPKTKAIENCLSQIDYSDTFSITNHTHSLAEITQKVFGTA